MITRKEKFRRSKVAGLRWFVCFSFLLTGYWWVMSNYVIRDFWDPQYAKKYELLRDRIDENPGRPLWLVMGSSRVDRGLRPALLADRTQGGNAPLIFNFGQGGASLFRQYICLRRIIESGVKPKRVGIEIMGATMSSELFQMADTPELLVRARSDELDDYAQYSMDPSFFISNWERSRWDPAYEYGMKLPRQALTWRLIPIPWVKHFELMAYDKWGWNPQLPAPIPEATYRKDFEIARGQFAGRFKDFKISRQTDVPLRKILDMCKNSGIEVFLLKMPEEKEFQAFYPPQAEAVIDSYLAKIEAEYGVQMIDARSWITEWGFSDGHHLNADGAAEFTKRFGDELFKTAKVQPSAH
jgi:hypothetical protein